MMKRDDCFHALKRRLTDEIVVATYTSAHDWIAIAPRDLNYFSTGAMGLASSHALGLALGNPDRRVVVLDGDGSLCMNLGTLVTIAAAGPRNFLHIVTNNGTYEANGAHPLPSRNVDFAGLARAAGYRHACTISELADFEAQIGTLLTTEGPVFVDLHVVPGAAYPIDYPNLYRADRREALKTALRAGR
ncbi:MAG: thiamine pyrophosphate-binding protein [Rhizobiales bacterium]|nr:thiamine pyrophosphate-binding protein [Hyphomicrobiales bacterium]